MSVITLEGVVENGQIKLRSNVQLPDKTKVFVIVPDLRIEKSVRVTTPRLAHPEQAKDFKLEVVKQTKDAQI